jgi:hypothetical protein
MKVKKEVDYQQILIDTCKSLGGFGDKIQDKYVKGKADLWLKLPSGLILFAEMKVVKGSIWRITPEFMPLQLDYLADLTDVDIPAIGIIIAISPKEDIKYKIASYFELHDCMERNNAISFHIDEFTKFYSFNDLIAGLELFFEGSTPQQYKHKPLNRSKLYQELSNDTVDFTS